MGWEKYEKTGSDQNCILEQQKIRSYPPLVRERERVFCAEVQFLHKEEFFSNKWWQPIGSKTIELIFAENFKFTELIENTFPQICLFT